MPPKVKINKDDIINAAVEILLEGGEASLNARNLALRLNCSTQPIFSNFKTMDELSDTVVTRVEEIFNSFFDEITYTSGYKAVGMAYISFAKYEKNLFKFLFLKNNQSMALDKKIEGLMVFDTSLSGDTAHLFYLEMKAFIMGMAVMTASDNFPLHDMVINQMLEDVYNGLKTRFNI